MKDLLSGYPKWLCDLFEPSQANLTVTPDLAMDRLRRKFTRDPDLTAAIDNFLAVYEAWEAERRAAYVAWEAAHGAEVAAELSTINVDGKRRDIKYDADTVEFYFEAAGGQYAVDVEGFEEDCRARSAAQDREEADRLRPALDRIVGAYDKSIWTRLPIRPRKRALILE
jgi:hypothetical protein